ncbi:MAG TPA: hypothetical protein VHC22_17615 [Pirellulales bacterium]|nr:hypothetical protein [Pirellulales bacterium]
MKPEKAESLTLGSIVKQLCKRVWKFAYPVRRAISARVDQQVDRHFQRWFCRTEHFQAEQERASGEMRLIADAMVREMVRLQMQIHGLREAVLNQGADSTILPAADEREAA